ncbi:helix-turn-helix domain-containing protein [Embleya sp. NPDC127516]|uniref:helix-turn-helix domain-containing protein n=1 Tax=Embleya sp. NPDC127516 TaxID=3363990 RepID=UPI00380AB37A
MAPPVPSVPPSRTTPPTGTAPRERAAETDPAAPLPDLAHFLRSRRARRTPESVGLARTGTRRLSGLRRAEVAALAGISPEYYTRLEQGRQRRPSTEVLDALARALHLDEDARRHLHRLAAGPPRPLTEAVEPPLVPAATRRLLDALAEWPAYVVSPVRDILAWNAAASWLITDFAELPAEQRNFAWFAFRDPRARRLYADWPAVARGNAHRLRDAVADNPHDPRGSRLVAELTTHGDRFVEFWGEHEVRGPTTGHKELHHPAAGPLSLDYTVYVLPGPHALELVVMTAAEDSPTHRALRHAAHGRAVR